MGNVLSFSNAKEMNGVVKVYSVYNTRTNMENICL